jgi:hypothetical protein
VVFKAHGHAYGNGQFVLRGDSRTGRAARVGRKFTIQSRGRDGMNSRLGQL